jgi:hypothetical protein
MRPCRCNSKSSISEPRYFARTLSKPVLDDAKLLRGWRPRRKRKPLNRRHMGPFLRSEKTQTAPNAALFAAAIVTSKGSDPATVLRDGF